MNTPHTQAGQERRRAGGQERRARGKEEAMRKLPLSPAKAALGLFVARPVQNRGDRGDVGNVATIDRGAKKRGEKMDVARCPWPRGRPSYLYCQRQSRCVTTVSRRCALSMCSGPLFSGYGCSHSMAAMHLPSDPFLEPWPRCLVASLPRCPRCLLPPIIFSSCHVTQPPFTDQSHFPGSYSDRWSILPPHHPTPIRSFPSLVSMHAV